MASSTKVVQSEAEKSLLSLCSKSNKDHTDAVRQVKTLLSSDTSLNVDTSDEDGMTPLMHAAYSGRYELCEYLIEKGADVNSNSHSEGYTALMFATITGHPKVVQLLLDSGANINATNNVNRTAAQMGGFVGQTECVQLINSYFSLADLRYYTEPQGLEVTPKLDPSLLSSFHQYITTPNIHPVKLLLMLQATQLHLHESQVCKVLGIICDKSLREDKEPFSLKLHLLSYAIKEANKTGLEQLLKNLLVQTDTGQSVDVDKYLRQSLKEYPHRQSVLLNQLVATLTKIPLGQPPTTVSLVVSAIHGSRGFADYETCATCGVSNDKVKKCSKCKKVWYCNVECQRLAWSLGNHKRLCKKWATSQATPTS